MEKKGNNKNTILFAIILILIFGLIGYDVYLNYNKKIIQTTNITKTEKEVTVTDKGIAEAVDKLYNATVIVEIVERSQTVGWGSGFVYKVDGDVAYVITNYHVTDGYDKATIEFTSGAQVEGTVIGGDEYTDVSVVKISSEKVIADTEKAWAGVQMLPAPFLYLLNDEMRLIVRCTLALDAAILQQRRHYRRWRFRHYWKTGLLHRITRCHNARPTGTVGVLILCKMRLTVRRFLSGCTMCNVGAC